MICEECSLPIEQCSELALERRKERLKRLFELLCTREPTRTIKARLSDLHEAMENAAAGDQLVIGT